METKKILLMTTLFVATQVGVPLAFAQQQNAARADTTTTTGVPDIRVRPSDGGDAANTSAVTGGPARNIANIADTTNSNTTTSNSDRSSTTPALVLALATIAVVGVIAYAMRSHNQGQGPTQTPRI